MRSKRAKKGSTTDKQRSAVKRVLQPKGMNARSKITNGTDGAMLPGVDQRTAIARRFRDIASLIVTDQGGEERMSQARIQLVRRFSAACVIAEDMEARMVNGETIDVQRHAHLCSTLVRIAGRIGLGRHLRNVTPSLKEYIEHKELDDEDEAERECDMVDELPPDDDRPEDGALPIEDVVCLDASEIGHPIEEVGPPIEDNGGRPLRDNYWRTGPRGT